MYSCKFLDWPVGSRDWWMPWVHWHKWKESPTVLTFGMGFVSPVIRMLKVRYLKWSWSAFASLRESIPLPKAVGLTSLETRWLVYMKGDPHLWSATSSSHLGPHVSVAVLYLLCTLEQNIGSNSDSLSKLNRDNGPVIAKGLLCQCISWLLRAMLVWRCLLPFS